MGPWRRSAHARGSQRGGRLPPTRPWHNPRRGVATGGHHHHCPTRDCPPRTGRIHPGGGPSTGRGLPTVAGRQRRVPMITVRRSNPQIALSTLLVRTSSLPRCRVESKATQGADDVRTHPRPSTTAITDPRHRQLTQCRTDPRRSPRQPPPPASSMTPNHRAHLSPRTPARKDRCDLAPM